MPDPVALADAGTAVEAASIRHLHSFDSQSDPSAPELAQMIAVQRTVLDELSPCQREHCGELVAHQRTLALLQRELRRRVPENTAASDPLRRARELADVLRFCVPKSHRRTALGSAITAAKRGLVEGLSPLHVEVLRPQFQFNFELVDVLRALNDRRGSTSNETVAPWRRRLEPLADPTRWAVDGHRERLAGAVVRLAKTSYLTALGPVLRPVMEKQRAWNLAVLDALEAALRQSGPPPTRGEEHSARMLTDIWSRCDPMSGEGVPWGAKLSAPLWNEILRRQVSFNRAITVLLFTWFGIAPPPEPAPTIAYEDWLVTREPAQIQAAAGGIGSLRRAPLISLVTPAYETPDRVLRECIESVRAQSYSNWELCIADDGSRSRRVAALLRHYSRKDSRIRFVRLPANEGIARATNAAIAIARGEYLGFLDHDDTLAPHALAEMALRLDREPEADLLYSDEDRIDDQGRRFNPFFKPDWSPDLLRAVQYICHFMLVRKDLVSDVGGLRDGFQGSQDYDLTLRLTERARRIVHVPKVLYHWRASPLSLSADPVKRQAAARGAARAVQEHLDRLAVPAEVLEPELGHNRVRYPLKGVPLVSIIVPFKDRPELLEKLYDSLTRLTLYPRFELLLISNNSTQAATQTLLDRLSGDPRVRVLTFDHPFNIPKLINFGARSAQGELLLLFNNDIEIVESGWLDELVGNAQRPEIGAVGCKLLFPNGRIQHGGTVVGLGGFASHTFAGLPDTLDWTPFGHPGWTRNYLAVTGACLMVRREVFEEVGGCDERFEVCGSDVDLCLRIGASGRRVLYTPHAKLIHHESATRGRSAVPEGDFWRSYQAYLPYLASGDPFYNPNLTLTATNNALRVDDASGEHLALHALAHDLPSAREPAAAARAQAGLHLSRHLDALDYPAARPVPSRAAADPPEALKAKGRLDQVTWLIPSFTHPFGGLHTALRFADLLRRRQGVQSHFVVYDNPQTAAPVLTARVAALFPKLPGSFQVLRRLDGAAALPECDLLIATFWESAFLALANRTARARAYFVQDYEPLFYPAGTLYGLAEQTYRLGLYGIFNSPGLHDFVTSHYPMRGCWFEPSVDPALFHADRRPLRNGPVRVFFYGRPSADRNGFELGLAALSKLKDELGSAVEIVSAGERWSPEHYGVARAITNLGVLPYEKTAELYRGCDLGLAFMFTKHPSYLPLEMMACGMTVVTNDNPANEWLFQHEDNCLLARPTAGCVLEQLRRACAEAPLRARLGARAAERLRRTTWEQQVDRVYNTVLGKVRTG